jgi:tetratricopeptide (TPR) repeat protein
MINQKKNKKIFALSALLVIIALYLAPLGTFQSNAAANLNVTKFSLTTNIGTVNDAYYGTTLTEVQQGKNVNISLVITPISCPTVGCNLSVGFGFDNLKGCCPTQNLTGYTNATGANPTSTLTALNDIPYLVNFQVTAPTTVTNLQTHEWEFAIANLARANTPSSTQTIVYFTVGGPMGIVSSDQAGYLVAYKNYQGNISNYPSSLFSGYQYTQAQSDSYQASIAATKAATYYQQGYFTQANIQMTQALSDYQQAIQSYQSTATSLAGAQNNYMTLLPYGALMLGIGAIIAGVGVILGGFRRGS